MKDKTAIILGAGPAGLTAAVEFIRKTGIKPVIFEKMAVAGGLSRTVNYKGNLIDLGGHRFFSKSPRILQWWDDFLPLQGKPTAEDIELGRPAVPGIPASGPDPEKANDVMLIRKRISRIYYLNKFFDYPVSLTPALLISLGIKRSFKIFVSYLKSALFPIKPEKNLEDFFINRFGRELYETFFRDYTEKLWGFSCREISPEWGAQRVKGLSVKTAVYHFLKKLIPGGKAEGLNGNSKTETSLIEYFLYPKYGPGQLWDKTAEFIKSNGGEIICNSEPADIRIENGRVSEIAIRDKASGAVTRHRPDYLISSIPVRELISLIGSPVPGQVKPAASGLRYRNFITVGLLLDKMNITNSSGWKTHNNIAPDNWIYIQEKDVYMGRIQIFNNWSPYLLKDRNKVWIGVEFFCDENDGLWNRPEENLIRIAAEELHGTGIIDKKHLIDGTAIKVEKAYPVYFGSYRDFGIIRDFTDSVENLFLIGRNGMHKYNNMDHSMLTAIKTVENIINGNTDKSSVWSLNSEDEYHEIID